MNTRLISSAVLAGLLTIASTGVYASDCKPAGKLVKLSLDDFLGAQGMYSTFFPPYPDYAGWTDEDFTTFALIDYAGLVDEVLDGSPDTEVRGRVTARPCRDGGAQVRVTLFAKNALGFAQCIDELIANDFDFAGTPTVFGNKAADVEMGEEPALGHSMLKITFRLGHVGDPLPDLLDVITDDTGMYAPVTLAVSSITFGECADGADCVLRVQQKAASSGGDLVYTKEVVDILGPTDETCPALN